MSPTGAPSEHDMIARRRKLLGPAYRLFYQRPVHFVRGEGVWLYDQDGQAYLDAYNNVTSLGHSHPHVAKAIAGQSAILSTHTRYLHALVLDYAETLLASFPAKLGNLMVVCSGSEANDLALRVAKVCSGGTGVIVTANAYHGVTETVAGASPSLGVGVPRGRDVWTVPAPRRPDADVGKEFAAGIAGALAEMGAANVRPAALLLDSIFSSDGVFADPAGFLRPAVEAFREAGGLYIADEVQSGFARTGEHMWGFMRHGIVPDLVTLGKPMGNGYPIAGLVAKPELLDVFGAQARYFNTFGGNATAAAAGMAVMEVIRDEGLLENAARVGAYLKSRLLEYAGRGRVGAVRGVGLFIGVDIVDPANPADPSPEGATRIANGLRERRVLVGQAGPSGECLKIRPPLVFSRENVDHFMECFDAACQLG